MEDYKFIIVKQIKQKAKVYQNNGNDLFYLRGDVNRDLLSRREVVNQNRIRTITFSNLDR